MEQRSGRIVRQGNRNKQVWIYRYATNGTFDSYLWQTVQKKQEFIAQIMSSKSPVRSCEDVDETALSYAEIKALCAGNPLIAEKMNLDVEVAKLRVLKADYQSQHYRLEDALLKSFPEQITEVTERIAGIEKDIELFTKEHEKAVETVKGGNGSVYVIPKFPGMTINGVKYTDKEQSAKALLESCKGINDKKVMPIGEYMGYNLSLSMEGFASVIKLNIRGAMTYQVELGTDAFGNITRINNALNDLPKKLEGAKARLESILEQRDAAEQELKKPFMLADELAEKEARLALLNADLNIEGDGGKDVENDAEPDRQERQNNERNEHAGEESQYDESQYERQAISAKSVRPSFLDGIRAYKAEKQAAVPGKKVTEHDI